MNSLKKILLVEDDPYDVELTLHALGESNLANRVDVVNDGEEALDYLFRRNKFEGLLNENPVVVLLDLKIPKITGIDVLKEIKKNKCKQHIPVVIITSSKISTDLEQCYDLGVNAFVTKPIKPAEFINAVKSLGIFWAVINEVPERKY